MSFDKLLANNGVIERKKKEIAIQVGTETLTFTATQISHVRRMEIDSLIINALEFLPKLLSYTITDQKGIHMSMAQARELSEEHANIFVLAALEVNSMGAVSEGEVKEASKPEDIAKKN